MPSDREIRLIQELQKGFDVCERPFAAMAERVGMTEEEVIACLQTWKESGVVRRAGVIVNHYKAGFGASNREKQSIWKNILPHFPGLRKQRRIPYWGQIT